MNKSLFGKIGGKDVYRYEISGDGVSVAVLDFGATVQAVTVDGTAITSVDDIEVGGMVRIHLRDGSAAAQIKEKEKDD